MPTAEVKGCLVSVYHLARKSAKLSRSSLLLGANANKAHPLIHLTDYALSLSLSACFLCIHSWCPSQRTWDNSKRRGLIACVRSTQHKRQNFWAQIILDPYRRPLTLTFLLVSTRGLFQDTMFERLHDSTFSEDASEVIVQPLPCGTASSNAWYR